MHPAEILRLNIEGQDLWFISPQGHVVFLPGGWWVEMSAHNAPYSDSDCFDANECYGYFASGNNLETAYEQWVDVRALANYRVVDEAEGRMAHPGLDQYIRKLNKGEKP